LSCDTYNNRQLTIFVFLSSKKAFEVNTYNNNTHTHNATLNSGVETSFQSNVRRLFHPIVE